MQAVPVHSQAPSFLHARSQRRSGGVLSATQQSPPMAQRPSFLHASDDAHPCGVIEQV